MNLKINGEMRHISDVSSSTKLEELLSALTVRKNLVAIALNETIIPRVQWEQTPVVSGDRIEIVHFVGGGSRLECVA